VIAENGNVATKVGGGDVKETVALGCMGGSAGINKASTTRFGRKEGTVGV
jgi:hypothetical protein